jgi:hypothetical protein
VYSCKIFYKLSFYPLLPIQLFYLELKSYPRNSPWRPIGLWDVEAPTFCVDSRLTDGGKVFSLTRRPPLTPQEDTWYSFLLKAESTPGPYCGWKDYVNWKSPLHRDSNPRPSGLLHSASTNYATALFLVWLSGFWYDVHPSVAHATDTVQSHGAVRTLCPESAFSLSEARKQSGPSRGKMLTDSLSHCLISFQVTEHWSAVASRRITRRRQTNCHGHYRTKHSAGHQQLRT